MKASSSWNHVRLSFDSPWNHQSYIPAIFERGDLTFITFKATLKVYVSWAFVGLPRCLDPMTLPTTNPLSYAKSMWRFFSKEKPPRFHVTTSPRCNHVAIRKTCIAISLVVGGDFPSEDQGLLSSCFDIWRTCSAVATALQDHLLGKIIGHFTHLN